MPDKEYELPRRPLWCQRCKKIIYREDEWSVSWFMNEEICTTCASVEDTIRTKLVRAGKNPADYEGCGYLPE